MVVGLEYPAQDRECGQVLAPPDTELEDVALDVDNLFVEMLHEEKPAEVLAVQKKSKILEEFTIRDFVPTD